MKTITIASLREVRTERKARLLMKQISQKVEPIGIYEAYQLREYPLQESINIFRTIVADRTVTSKQWNVCNAVYDALIELKEIS